MKKINLKKFIIVFVFLIITLLFISWTKSFSYTSNKSNYHTDRHVIDPRLVGKWMWTKSSDGAYYNSDGVYSGSAYGFATQYQINTDGSGTCFSHVHSAIGAGTGLEVNISSVGFFESDDQGHLGYFPTSGTYKSSSGTNRALRADELWNTATNTGKNFLYQKVMITKQGGRECFQITSKDGITDTFFKVQ